MDELIYNYFSNLIKFTTNNKIILIFLSFIENEPLLSFFYDVLFDMRKYINNKEKNALQYNISNFLHKSSIYYNFTKLKNNDHLYSSMYMLIYIALILFLIVYFFFFTKRKEHSKIHSNIPCMIIVSFVDIIIMRTSSLYIFEIVINHICNSLNIGIVIVNLVILSILLTFYCIYLFMLRLILKFDCGNKYPFDNELYKYFDYCALTIKVIMCFDSNANNERINFFLHAIAIGILCISIIVYIKYTSVSNVYSLYSFFALFILISFFLNAIFISLDDKYSVILFYIVVFVFTVFSIRCFDHYKEKLYLRCLKEPNKELYKHQLKILCEYYGTNKYKSMLRKCLFNSKIENNEKSSIAYLKVIAKMFKQDDNKNYSKEFLFYYMISRIFKELGQKKANHFKLLFQTWSILQKIKNYHFIYYLNLKYYYQLLCDEQINNSNGNLLVYSEAYNEIKETIHDFIIDYSKFIKKGNLNETNDYMLLIKKLNVFYTHTQKHYNALIRSSIKDQYQDYVLRLIIESLLNQPISKSYASMLIEEQIINHEEFLEKQFTNSKHLLVKLSLHDMNTSIIKSGKDFNCFLNKSFDYLFPAKMRSLANKILFKKIKTNDEEVSHSTSGDAFKFIAIDFEGNYRLFVYFYKIFPNITKGITYIDGFYQIGKEPLIVSDYIDENTDAIISVSKKYESNLYLTQEVIDVLNKYQLSINIKEFVLSEEKLSFNIGHYINYLQNIQQKISNLLLIDDFECLTNLFKTINSINSSESKMRLTFQMSLTLKDKDNNKEFRVYKILNNKKTITREKTNTTKLKKTISATQVFTNRKEGTQLLSYNSILSQLDTGSLSSNTSSTSSYSYMSNLKIKRRSTNKISSSCNLLVLSFNFFIIIFVILSYYFFDGRNDKYSRLFSLYESSSNIKQITSGVIMELFVFLCIPDEGSTQCKNYFNDYFIKHNEYKDLFNFCYADFQLTIDAFSNQYNTLSKEISYRNYFNEEKIVIHILYDNKTLQYQYYDNNFNSAFLSLLSKIMVIKSSDNFLYEPIFPLKLNDTFFPINFVDTSLSIDSLSTVQTYIYEILLTYLHYIDYLTIIQNDIYNDLLNTIDTNMTLFIVVIIILIVLNIILSTFYVFFLVAIPGVITKKLKMFSMILSDEEYISKMNKKIDLLRILSRLYAQNPVILINKLKKTEKKKTIGKKYTKDNKINQNVQQKEFNTKMITMKYYKFIVILLMIYIIYAICFIFIYRQRFIDLNNLSQTLFYSLHSEDDVYILIGLIQMFYHFSFLPNSLNNIMPNILMNSLKDDEEDFLLTLMNEAQTCTKNEQIYKSSLKTFPSNEEIITAKTCEDLYIQINDWRFNQIFSNDTENIYKEQIINFCKKNPSIQKGGITLLHDDILYKIMKLALTNSNRNKEEITKPDDEMYSLMGEIFFLFRPIRNAFNEYYFSVVVKNHSNHDLLYLLLFTIGCDLIQIINIIFIKCFLFKQIDTIMINIDKLSKMLNNDIKIGDV